MEKLDEGGWRRLQKEGTETRELEVGVWLIKEMALGGDHVWRGN